MAQYSAKRLRAKVASSAFEHEERAMELMVLVTSCARPLLPQMHGAYRLASVGQFEYDCQLVVSPIRQTSTFRTKAHTMPMTAYDSAVRAHGASHSVSERSVMKALTIFVVGVAKVMTLLGLQYLSKTHDALATSSVAVEPQL
jgi:hypothetical protein